MKKFTSNAGKVISAVLTAAMLVQTTALAAPIDELNEIFENQEALEETSLLDDTLGFSELEKAIEKNGLGLWIRAGMTEELAEALELSDTEFANGYLSYNIQVDPGLKKWLFGAGVSTEEGAILDAALYGDTEQLALTIPQLFAGAVAVRAGSFRDQYINSDLAGLIGETENIPDFDMKFYPEESDGMEVENPFAELKEQLEEKGEEIQEDLQVEKTEADERTVYTVRMDTEDIMDIYRLIMDGYISAFSYGGLLTYGDVSDMETDMDQVMDEMEAMLGEQISVNITVKDGLVEKIDSHVFIDTTPYIQEFESEDDELITELVQEIAKKAGDAADAGNPETEETDAETAAEEETAADDASAAEDVIDTDPASIEVEYDEFRGYCDYELVYADPQHPLQGFEVSMVMTDELSGKSAAMKVSKQTQTEDLASTTTIGLELKENEESIYSGTPISVVFDANTGDLDAVLTLPDTDTGEEVELRLDSTFSEIEKGSSFLWTIDGLTAQAEGESLGVTAEIRVSADPGTIETPQNERVLFELTQSELILLMSEISVNLEGWLAQFEPETEQSDGDFPADMTLESETEEEAFSTAIIGGADGPTSVFVAGKVG